MLGLFLLCALLPTILLAVIGYRHVSGQLRRQSEARLQEASKAIGMAIIERLQMSEEELRTVAGTARPSAHVEKSRLRGIALLEPGKAPVPIRDSFTVIPAVTRKQEEHLATGGAIIATMAGKEPRILMGIRLGPGSDGWKTLWAELDRAQLWGPSLEDGARISLCVVGSDGTFLTCPPTDAGGISLSRDSTNETGDGTWMGDGENHLAQSWTAFLGFQWATPSWTVFLSQPESSVLAPMLAFRRTFLVVMALALVLVFLLSNIQIRRRMEPLVRLQQGTQRVATGNFAEPVVVASGDEFEHLAVAFNGMTQRLGRQFNALSVINDIGRVALSGVSSDQVMGTALTRMGMVFPLSRVALLFRGPGHDHWRATTDRNGGPRTSDMVAPLDQLLKAGPEPHLVLSAQESRMFRPCFKDIMEDSRILLLPLRNQGAIEGVIAIAFAPGLAVVPEDIAQASQIADQLAVAVANTRLLERLDQLSWGTLSALARTIDANSPWTAGHSERVTVISLAIGREMGLPARALDAIHRGGLLHDIGKIGIPAVILDKAGRLTDEEMEIVKSHPVVGARILAPISVFQDIIPIVRNHHEKFDGTGYPDGLAGTDIPLLARVVAVADVYDALVSDRPYRAGWTRQAALEEIRRTASAHHDPVIVAAFDAALSNGSLDQAILPFVGEAPAQELTLVAGAAS